MEEEIDPNKLSREEIRKMLKTAPPKFIVDAKEEGKKESSEKIAINMLKKGMEISLIVEITELPEEKILALKENLSKNEDS